MNTKLLRSKMVLFGDTYESLSNYLGITVPTLCQKINHFPKKQFTQTEIMNLSKRYKLGADEIVEIFFDEVY